ncbi:MFS transporter [Poseidonibacter ostreae]|mgnify:FL=1|jgi:MFS family permease|uniref:MFS transporter n=3 Tax=Poseidonibacter ostreae TaxID=2654171 RepID=A0A6L4WT13_9BACT|nr:MFS transporter [Poseidonibacter ostreae]KAB7888088.1 MFS transporter [Poseidonibacter ostreae]KAB7891703.1 MFS transporter [Poseidonibacter ostreae]
MNNIKKLTIFTLLLLAMTTSMSNVAIVTALPHLKDHFTNVSNIEFYSRLMLTLPSFVIALLAPILGHIIFKYGKKKSVIIALIVFSISGSAGLYLQTLEMLLFSRAIFGIAVATLMIVSTSLIGDYFKLEHRHKFMGYQSAFMALGGVVFVVGGGVLSDINWRYSFSIYLIGFILLPFVITQIKEVIVTEDSSEEIEVDSNMYFIYFLAFFYMIIFFILPTQIPFLLIEKFKASGSFAGTIIAIAFAFNALGAITFSKIKNRYSYSTIYLIGLFIIAIGFAGVGLIKETYLFFITSPLLGFGGGIMMTNITAWMLSKTSIKKRVKTSGYFTSAIFLGQFSSPIVFHPLVSFLGVQSFFFTIGISLFVIIVFSLLYIKIK